MERKENPTDQIISATLELKSREYITPHYIRITLTGAEVYRFAETTIGVNNKIYIPPAGVNEIHKPVWDPEHEKWNLPPEEVRPSIRTYTHRGIDLEKNEMTIDFVAHGDDGPASSWAIHALPGDKLGIGMRSKSDPLHPEADWYLLAGDATAIPVLGVILERLPETAQGIAYIEVHGPEDEQVLLNKSGVKIVWLHNPVAGEGNLLVDAIKQTALPEEGEVRKFGYIAAEFTAVRNIRKFLRVQKDWELEELYAYSYWKYGVAEDGSVKDRSAESEDK